MEWFRTYFTEPYGEIYEEYLLPPEMAAQECDFACEALGLQPGDAVLDCPCGYGRHLNCLLPLFREVVGLDFSPDCMRRARESAPHARLVRGDMRALPFGEGRFDAVMNLFNSFGYFSERGDRVLLREFARVLAPGGRLLIDVANPGPLTSLIGETPRTRQQVLDLLLTESWRYDAASGVLHNDTEIELAGRRTERSYDLRLYTLGELEAMLAEANLGLVQVYGEFTGEPYDETESTRMIVVAEARA